MAEQNIIDRFFGTMQPCDTDVLRDCLTEDAIVWHSFDRKAMRPDDVVKSWEGMATSFSERGVATFVASRRQPAMSSSICSSCAGRMAFAKPGRCVWSYRCRTVR